MPASPASIRAASPADEPALARLYAAAFPEEDLFPIVKALSGLGDVVLSLVATADERGGGQPEGTRAPILGHVAFSRCGVDGRAAPLALLAPLCAAPEAQRGGIGSALVREGFRRLEEAGVRRVLVLGDPGYYGRFGFTPETAIAPPYDLPEAWRAAWQGASLGDGPAPPPGRLTPPGPWMRPALWGP
ncbi:GNAT family N-acetyltransferase [Salinarimonas sp.]|uniref:GNAT family N-acetyltransferase n=1 Tax=Salinarimonas sp. TaxID=2766526 RepID=UPI0032D9785B